VLVEQDALELPCARNLAVAHAADEHVALPFREPVAGIEREAGRRDRRHPEHARRLETVVRRVVAFVLPRPRIRPAEAHDRPAVVRAGPEHVELVAAVRAHLELTELARGRMNGEPERAAVAERIDLRTVARAARER